MRIQFWSVSAMRAHPNLRIAAWTFLLDTLTFNFHSPSLISANITFTWDFTCYISHQGSAKKWSSNVYGLSPSVPSYWLKVHRFTTIANRSMRDWHSRCFDSSVLEGTLFFHHQGVSEIRFCIGVRSFDYQPRDLRENTLDINIQTVVLALIFK